MSTDKPISLLRLEYEKAAEAYLRSLPPEHFMEAIAQATQRETTVGSLAVVKVHRSDMQYFSELLVQYPARRGKRIRQVVPDNMVVVHDEPIRASGSYDLPLQPVGPFWVMEYVSKHSERKDYEDSFHKYERELKVPYYLVFYPDNQELTLFHHSGTRYRTVAPNEAGRYAIPELDLEVGLLDGWVRFWYKGKLVPLPADLERQLEEVGRQLRQAREQARLARKEANRAQEQARLAEEQKRQAEEQKRQAEEQKRQAEEQARQAEEQTRQAEEQTRQAEEQTRQAEEHARLAREREEREREQKERLLAQLRELGIEPRR